MFSDGSLPEWQNLPFKTQMVEIGTVFFLKRQRLRRNSAPDLDYLGQQLQRNLNLFHLDWKASSYARNCLDKAASLQGNGAGVPSLRPLLSWIPHKPLGVHISVTTSCPFWGQPKDFLQFLDPFCGKTFWLFLCLNKILYLVLINNALFFSRTLPAFFKGHFELFLCHPVCLHFY